MEPQPQRLHARPERLSIDRETGPRRPLHAVVVRDEERTTISETPDGDWRALEVEGPIAFTVTGVMASLAGPLAEAGVSLFAVSTYDTDVLLVHATQFEAAVAALRAAGHTIDD